MNPDALLRHAVRLAKEKMLANEGGPFGAVIAKDGKVLAEGWNQVTSHNDPTAHAEVVAIRRACKTLGRFDLKGCVLYASCEPCPMCLAAAYWARVDHVVFANTRQQAAQIGFDDDFIYREIPLDVQERSLPMEHRPMAEADEVFDAWTKKEDKIRY